MPKFNARHIFAAIFGALLFHAAPALATTCSVPYNATNGISNGQPAQAAQINANFAALVYCGNNIDATNFAAGGIYASQIVPANGAQATFGGTQAYTFPSAVTVNGNLTSTGFGGFTGYVQGQYISSNYSANQGLFYGGGNNTSQLDYNITTPNSWTFSSPLKVSGAITNTGNIVSSGHGTFTNYVQGQYISSNYSANQGLFYGGGNNTSQLDYNISAANAWTFNAPLIASTTIRTAANGNMFVAPYDAQAGGSAGSASTHIEHGNASITILASNTSGCTTVTFAIPFSQTPSVVSTQNATSLVLSTSEISSTTNTSLCLIRSATGPQVNSGVNWIAIGE